MYPAYYSCNSRAAWSDDMTQQAPRTHSLSPAAGRVAGPWRSGLVPSIEKGKSCASRRLHVLVERSDWTPA